MLKRFGHILTVVALLTAIGTHWVVLQTVAWSTMLAGNLSGSSFVEAVERTFDGKHPCTLCNKIAAGKKSEKKAEFPSLKAKLEFVAERSVFRFSPPQDFRLVPAGADSPHALTHRPPVPPPRSLPA